MTRSFREQFSRHLFEQKTLRSERLYVFVLLLAAVLTRAIGITYGLPTTYNSTEYFIAKHALSLGARHTLEPLYFIYPTLMTYLTAGLYGMYFFVGFLLGRFPSPDDFALEFLLQPGNFYLLGRILVAAIVIVGIVYGYRTLRLYLEPRGALFFSLLLVFSYNVQFYTFWMVPDALLFTGTILVFYFILKWHKMGIRRNEIPWAGLICGLTLSAKYNAGFLPVGLIGAVLLNNPRRRFSLLRNRLSLLVPAILAGFLLGTPYWLLAFPKFREGLQTVWSQAQYDYNITTGMAYLWEIREILRTEWALGGVLLSALFWSMSRPRKQYWPVLLVVYPTFLVVGSWEKKGLDYLLIIFPLLTLQAGLIYADHFRGKGPRPLITALILLVFIPSLIHVGYLKFLYTREDTRQQATRWITLHVPQGSKICYDHYHYDLNLIDRNRFTRYGKGAQLLSPELKERLSRLPSFANQYRLVSPRHRLQRPRWPGTLDSARIHQYAQNPFLVEQFSHPFKTLKELLLEGTEWLILNSETFQKYLTNPPPAEDNPLRTLFLSKRAFYEELFRRYQPVQVFRPNWKTPGPEIRIYFLGKTDSTIAPLLPRSHSSEGAGHSTRITPRKSPS